MVVDRYDFQVLELVIGTPLVAVMHLEALWDRDASFVQDEAMFEHITVSASQWMSRTEEIDVTVRPYSPLQAVMGSGVGASHYLSPHIPAVPHSDQLPSRR